MNLYFTLDETVNFVSYSFNVTLILFFFVSVDILTNKVYIYINLDSFVSTPFSRIGVGWKFILDEIRIGCLIVQV